MDIENMHPFCLPFGFCHDATSSSIAADFSSPLHNNNNNNNNNHKNNNNNSNNIESETSSTNDINNKEQQNKIRSKTSSPSDELFKHFHSTSTSGGSLLISDEDLIIGSSSALVDIGAPDESFYSLELDIDIDDDDNGNFSSARTALGGLETSGNIGHDDDDDDDGNKSGDADDDDWYCSQYSLFSPSPTGAHHHHHHPPPTRRKSLIRSALLTGALNLNQVFQHVVDPIDIKSSPTLAQLNLNSTDDPSDTFWDTATAAANRDLLPNSSSHNNSTSINGPGIGHHHHHHHHHQQHLSCSGGHNSLTCNHLHHLHQHHSVQANHNHLHNHHHHHHLPPYSSHLAHNAPSSPACHHVHQSRFNSSSSSSSGGSSNQPISSTQSSTCLAVTPFRRSTTGAAASAVGAASTDVQAYSTCCHNLLSTTSSTNLPNGTDNNNTSNSNSSTTTTTTTTNNNNNIIINNLKPSATLNQLNQQQQVFSSNSGSNSSQQQPRQQQQQQPTGLLDKQAQKIGQQQRSASPALVTSSSSPLSSVAAFPPSTAATSANSTTATATTAHAPTSAATGDNRLIDNKLKENIEYLTALLCNGNNKLDNGSQQHQLQQQQQQQQATISSSMARSYTTLAHSLSTGPKLLERHSQPVALSINQGQQQQQQTKALLASHQHQQTNSSNPTNEAAPSVDPIQQQQQQNLQQHQMLHQQPPNALKRPYSDQWFKLPVESSVSAADSTDQSQTASSLSNELAHNCPTKLSTCTQQQQQHSHQPPTQMTLNGQLSLEQRQKSSDLKVLSSLLSSNNCPTTMMSLNPNSQGWSTANCVSQPSAMHTGNELSTRLPLDPSTGLGRPAEPISIPAKGKPITLKPLATSAVIVPQPKMRSNLFAQPASPSASSTASSGTNTDLGSTSTGNSAKRQRGNQTQAGSSSSQKSGGGGNAGSNRSARPNSLSTDCSLSSHDEGFSSQIDNDDCISNNSDDDDDVDSDDESFYGDYTNSDLIGASISDNAENKWTLNMGRTRRNGQKRYFWQYNVQSKGPKGTRICSTDDSEDPFVLPEASDPVFSNDCQVEGVKHSGKARRGDGNDLTPNPRKLLMIGLELKKLGKIINDLAPVTDLPVNARNKTRKEKNKLASRACRLKKKAQHEANKIKLYGLQREHQQVVLAIYDIRKLLNAALQEKETKQHRLQQAQQIEQTQELTATNDNGNTTSTSVKTIAEQCSMIVAGQTSDYVNSVLEKVVSGCIDGGLQT